MPCDAAHELLQEAQAICEEHGMGIQVADLFELPVEMGGGFSVNLSVPEHLDLQDLELPGLVRRLEAIPRVTRVFVITADSGHR